MSLAPGTRVGVYEILGASGAGGMGEVYRARDERLHRDVAIKVAARRRCRARRSVECFDGSTPSDLLWVRDGVLLSQQLDLAAAQTFTLLMNWR